MPSEKNYSRPFLSRAWLIGLAGLSILVVSVGLGYHFWSKPQPAPQATEDPPISRRQPAPRVPELPVSKTFTGEPKTSVDGLIFFPDASRLASTSSGTVSLWDVEGGKETPLPREDLPQEGTKLLKSFRQARRAQDLGLKQAALTLAQGLSQPLTLLPGLALDVAKELDQDNSSEANRRFTLAVASVPSALYVVPGNSGPILFEYGAIQFRSEDKADTSSKELLLARLSLKGHVCKKDAVESHAVAWSYPGAVSISCGFAVGGRQLLLSGTEGELLMVTIATEEKKINADLQPLSFQNPEGKLRPLLLLPDGKQAMMADPDKKVSLWDLTTSKQVGNLEGVRTPLTALAVSTDGKRLLIGDQAIGLCLWDLPTAKELRRFEVPEGKLRSAALSADGTRLLTQAEGGGLVLWDAQSGQSLAILKYLGQTPTALALSADGRRAAVASGNIIRFWDLPAEIKAE